MFVRILCRGGLPMRMPSSQNGTLDEQLRLRGCLQMRASMQLQIEIERRDSVAYCAFVPDPTAGRGPIRGITSNRHSIAGDGFRDAFLTGSRPLASPSRRCKQTGSSPAAHTI
jgi:hypothetical protein